MDTNRPEPSGSLASGVRLLVGSAFFFSLSGLFVKLAGQSVPFMQTVWARAVVGLLISWLMLRRAGAPLISRDPAIRRLLLVRSLFGLSAMILLFYSFVVLPLSDAMVLYYLNPVFVVVASALFFGERMGPRGIVAAGVSFLGVLVVSRPAALFGLGPALPPLGVAAALLGSVLGAGAMISVRRLTRTEHPVAIVFFFCLVTFVVSSVAVAPSWVAPSGECWLHLLGVGVTTQIAQVLMNRGFAQVPAGTASSVLYIQIVFAAVLGALVFGELPDAWSVCGALLVIGGAVGLSRGERKPAQERGV